MPAQHRQIPLPQATAGMVLSDDILDAQGKTLLAKNVTLTDIMLAALKRHQVEVISVVSGEITEEELDAQRRRHEARLDHLFRKPANDVEDATGILKDYVRYYRLGGEEQ
jgi:hypothetical protein